MKYRFVLFFLYCILSANAQQNEVDTLNKQEESELTEELPEELPEGFQKEEESEGSDEPVDLFVPSPKTDSFKMSAKYTLWANGNFSLGNVHRALIETGGKVEWKASKWLKMSSALTFSYGEQQHIVAERETFGDLHASFLYTKRWYIIAFGSAEASNLRKINLRWLGAGGVGFKIIEKEGKLLSITNALIYESSDYIEKADISVLRNSTRLMGDFDLFKKHLKLQFTYFVQPSIFNKNLRANGNISTIVPITNGLKFSFNMRHSYESYVSTGRANHDWNWTFGLRWEL